MDNGSLVEITELRNKLQGYANRVICYSNTQRVKLSEYSIARSTPETYKGVRVLARQICAPDEEARSSPRSPGPVDSVDHSRSSNFAPSVVLRPGPINCIFIGWPYSTRSAEYGQPKNVPWPMGRHPLIQSRIKLSGGPGQ
jgi:hypothetical protein